MRLSIVIIFCDKDFKYLSNIINNVEKFIKVEHEIILVDNRNDQTPFETKYKVVSKGKNCYIFEGRRIGLDAATGDYVWFIDVDDEIINEISESDLKSRTEKIIQLYYLQNGNNSIKLNSIKNNILCFGSGNWCRLYKTDVLKKALFPIKRDIDLINGEDRIILDFMLNECKEKEDIYILQNKYIYNYIISRAAIHSKNIESLKRGILGDSELDYIYSFLPDSFQKEKERIKEINNNYRNMIKLLQRHSE